MEVQIKKVIIPRFGDESVLEVLQVPILEPKAGEVQVRVLYSVVAGSDVNMRRGTYPFQKKPPLTPGYSMIGEVVANGPGCKRYSVGRIVACLTVYGAHAERLNAPERYLEPVPGELDFEQAVPLILDWMTAYSMLQHTAAVKLGQRIFVHGLSGAVGTAFLHLARMREVEVFGTAAVNKHQLLQKSGAVPFDYKSKDWIAEVQRRGGVDVVFDPLGYQSFDESYSILRKGGLLVGYGQNLPALTHTPWRSPLPMLLKLFARNLAFWSGKRTTLFGLTRRSKHFSPDLAQLFRWLAEGRFPVHIKASFSLPNIQEAHRTYAQNSGVGSIVLKVGG